ncbi:MAG: hypothetical protein ABJB03_05480 [Rhodoglobus sp.]
MKELHDDEGPVFVENRVTEALEHLAVALAESRMSATVTLHPSDQQGEISFTLGMDRPSDRPHAVRAKPETGEPSHLGPEDL